MSKNQCTKRNTRWTMTGGRNRHFCTVSEKLCDTIVEIEELHDMSSDETINKLKAIFFVKFRQFAKDWGFQHDTSSPQYPQPNGLVERHIQTLAMLELNNTSIDHNTRAPAEMMFTRIPRSLLSFRPGTHTWYEQDQVQLRVRQEKQRYYHNKGCKELKPLLPGEDIFYNNEGQWDRGTGHVVGYAPQRPRSYVVLTPGEKYIERIIVQLH
ncbi:hypothetical protein PR048_012356 [Dryococelus australis]|uniref:Integrase catalytic domain-containing protein n=1 Tax=Dryococelus australis TaxID=614101 RepID=A0ABQ9HPH7_9NEOP|nr:hypothetical protein PR048_012356 [Dryococelus australis]